MAEDTIVAGEGSFNQDCSDDETTDNDLPSSESEITEDSDDTGESFDKDRRHYDTASKIKSIEPWVHAVLQRIEKRIKELEVDRAECACPVAQMLVDTTMKILFKEREDMEEKLEEITSMKHGDKQREESLKDMQSMTGTTTGKDVAQEKLKNGDPKGEESFKEDAQNLIDMKTEKNTAAKDNLIRKHEDQQGEESFKEDTQNLTDTKTEKNTAEKNNKLIRKHDDQQGEETVTDEDMIVTREENFNQDCSDNEMTDDDLLSSESETAEDSSDTGESFDECYSYYNTTSKIQFIESWVYPELQRIEKKIKELEVERAECACPVAQMLVDTTMKILFKEREDMEEKLEEIAASLKHGDKQREESLEDMQSMIDTTTAKDVALEKLKNGEPKGEETVTDEKVKQDSVGISDVGGSFHKRGQEGRCMLDLKPDSSLEAEKEMRNSDDDMDLSSDESIAESIRRRMQKALFRSFFDHPSEDHYFGNSTSTKGLEDELHDLQQSSRKV